MPNHRLMDCGIVMDIPLPLDPYSCTDMTAFPLKVTIGIP
jgi:hypothetical protein